MWISKPGDWVDPTDFCDSDETGEFGRSCESGKCGETDESGELGESC